MSDRAQHLRQLVELAPDGILIHDGVSILSGNPAVFLMAGAMENDELVGKPVSLLLEPPYLKDVQRQLLGSLPTGAIATPVRERFRRLDGSTLQVETRAVVFLDEGTPAVHLMIRDITARLELEEAAKLAAERAEQAQRGKAVGALAGGVAHELNNMISVILGSANFVLQDATVSDATRADVRAIVDAGERVATVTRQLLAFSQHSIARPELLDVRASVEHSLPGLRHVVGGQRELVARLDVTPPVLMDPDQLAQVVQHLVSNALDATHELGQITISTARIMRRSPVRAVGGEDMPPGDYAVITVRDDGRGMKHGVLEHIFEPFFTTKPVGQGTGLGLAAVKGIVTQAGGFITVESVRAAGSTFSIHLPAADTAREEVLLSAVRVDVAHGSRAVTPWAKVPGGHLVLVVDDEPAIRAVVVRTLQGIGLRVVTAGDGLEALALMEREGVPHLLLTDLRMPHMGGAELVRRAKEQWPDLPVLVMSGYPAEYLIRDGTIRELHDVLQKPFNTADLVQHVSDALDLSPLDGTSPIG